MKSYTVRVQCEIVPVNAAETAAPDDVDEISAVANRIVSCIAPLASGGRVRLVRGNVVDFYLDTEDKSSPIEAVLAGTSTLRTAAHAALVSTEGWPEAAEWSSYMEERAVEAFEKPSAPVPQRHGVLI